MAIYYVKTTGNDTTGNGSNATPWASLYKASQMVTTTGNTIYISGGTYQENIMCSISVGVSIVGEGIYNTIIKSQLLITGSTSKVSATISLISSTDGTDGNQSISNLTLDGDNMIGCRAVLVKKRSNVKIYDCIIKDFFLGGLCYVNSASYDPALPSVFETGNDIYNCQILNCGDTATTSNGDGDILISCQENMLIHDNIFINTGRTLGHNGYIINGGGRHFKNVKYYNNKSYKPDWDNNWNFHLELWHIEGPFEIYDNEFWGSENPIDLGGNASVYTGNVFIHDNLFQPISGHGNASGTAHSRAAIIIESYYTDGIYVYNNHTKNFPRFLSLGDSPNYYCEIRNIYINNNLIENSGYGGGIFSSVMSIQVERTGNTMENVYIYNNTIVSDNASRAAAIDILVGDKSGNTPVPGGTLRNVNIKNNIMMYHTNQSPMPIANNGLIDGLHIENNLCYNLANYNIFPTNWVYSGGTTSGYTYLNNIPTSNTSQINPLLNVDFSLQSGSTCRNAGQDVGLSFQGLAPDMGCFETNTYYFSNNGSDSYTSTDANKWNMPWKTITKFNNLTFTAGYDVRFRKGDTWNNESFLLPNSGSITSGITLSSYGNINSSKPIINGFTTLSGWIQSGSTNIYYITGLTSQSNTNIVLINGVNTAMGRYPESGFLTYESFSDSSHITDISLTGTPNWTGAEAVIRKNKWMVDRNFITDHTTNTLTYISGTTWTQTAGYGYFIQNTIKTLTYENAWYSNTGTSTFYLYSTTNPSTKIVKVGTTDRLYYNNDMVYWIINGLDFVGANTLAIEINSGNTVIKNCAFNYLGQSGVYVSTTGSNSNLDVDNCTFLENNSNGICVLGSTNVLTATHNILTNIGLLHGMGLNSDISFDCIVMSGPNSLAEYNYIYNVGHIGINLITSDGMICRNNYIENFGLTRYEAGGIYSWKGSDGMLSRNIYNNIINGSNQSLDGVGSSTSVGLYGIYLDEYSKNVNVYGNSVANSYDAGLHILNSNYCFLSGNTLYNSDRGFSMVNAFTGGLTLSAITFNNNIVFAKTSTQHCIYYRQDRNLFPVYGTSNNNYYVRPVNDTTIIVTSTGTTETERTLSEWRTLVNQDANSVGTPFIVTDISHTRFEYNNTTGVTYIVLNSTYYDVKNVSYSGTITLQPFTSIILIKSSKGISFGLSGKILTYNNKIILV